MFDICKSEGNKEDSTCLVNLDNIIFIEKYESIEKKVDCCKLYFNVRSYEEKLITEPYSILVNESFDNVIAKIKEQ